MTTAPEPSPTGQPMGSLGSSGEAEIVTRLRAAGCVFAEDEARLLIAAARSPADLGDMVDRRVAGLPLEQVIGWAEFCGLRIAVSPGVFVPRRRTEFLVARAAAIARSGAGVAARTGPALVVVDLCCGSGAVGAALSAELGRIDLYCVDLDPVAVDCARRNTAAGGRVYQGDLYTPLPAALRGHVDLLVANAPYVPTAAIGFMPPEARLHEPPAALDGGRDGLDIQRRVISSAPEWLAPDGHLLVETSAEQASRSAEIATSAGLVARLARDDELDATVLIATRLIVARRS